MRTYFEKLIIFLLISRCFSIIDIIVFEPFTLILNIALINIQYVNHSTLSPNISYFISHFLIHV